MDLLPRLMHRLALEAGVITDDVAPRAADIRDHLARLDQAPRWTTIENESYGVRHGEAPALPGVHDFFRRCRKRALAVAIVGQIAAKLVDR